MPRAHSKVSPQETNQGNLDPKNQSELSVRGHGKTKIIFGTGEHDDHGPR